MDKDEQSDKTLATKKEWLLYLRWLFTPSGFVDGKEFIGMTFLPNIIYYNIMQLGCSLLSIVCFLPVFYLNLMAIQKRCRDIQIKGTVFILLYSVCTTFLDYRNHFKLFDFIPPFMRSYWALGLVCLYGVFWAVMIFWPESKKKKDLSLISPLIEHRYVYTGGYFLLYLIGYYLLFLSE